MGCSCIGTTIKIKSNISIIIVEYVPRKKKQQIPKTKDEKDFLVSSESYKTQTKTECSSIYRVNSSFSNNVQKNDRKENEKKNIIIIEREKDSDVNNIEIDANDNSISI